MSHERMATVALTLVLAELADHRPVCDG